MAGAAKAAQGASFTAEDERGFDMNAARRGLLATIGGATVVPPLSSALTATSLSHIGKVETLACQLPALRLAAEQAEHAILGVHLRSAEWSRLHALALEAAQAILLVEDSMIETPPETVMDALLLIALAAHLTRGFADNGMNHEGTHQCAPFVAGVSRRAADFIAASMGRDLGAVRGSECWQQQGNGA